MAWNPLKSDDDETRRMPLLALLGWGVVATSSFAAAFMALQFSSVDEPSVVAEQAVDTIETGSLPDRSEIGIMQRGTARQTTRTQELSGDVELLREELVALRRTVTSMRQSRDQLTNRLRKVEDSYAEITAAISRGGSLGTYSPPKMPPLRKSSPDDMLPPMPPIPDKQAQRSPRKIDPPVRQVKAPSKPANRTAPPKSPANAQKRPDPVTTASIPATEPTEPSPDQRPERTEFAIDLGGYASLATLAKGWRDLKTKQKALVGDLAPRASLSDKNGRLEVRLVAGPFANAAHAITLCAQLQAAGRACQPTLFIGQPVAD
ncbi:MAG: SPOR domain-containing protein [Pseudomonadota bacterium]